MIRMLSNAIVTIITVTCATQYLSDIVSFDVRNTNLQKCQQDKLLIRQMILLDYENSKNKKVQLHGNGFKIDDIYYIKKFSSRKIIELYKHSPNHTRFNQEEVISSQVKDLVIQQNMIKIFFKHPKCKPLVINCASSIEW